VPGFQDEPSGQAVRVYRTIAVGKRGRRARGKQAGGGCIRVKCTGGKELRKHVFYMNKLLLSVGGGMEGHVSMTLRREGNGGRASSNTVLLKFQQFPRVFFVSFLL
jgi:hypothetical protein